MITQMRAEHHIGRQEPVWVSVKRAIPMNRTVEIVQAFEAYCEDHPLGRLVIICGDDVSAYSDHVKRQVSESPHAERIVVLDRWLTAAEVAGWLQLADFSVSVPISDQMSNAVLEAMACGTVPVLLSIEGYGSLKEREADVYWLDECHVESLAAAFRASAGWSRAELATRQQAATRFIAEHYANRRVKELLQALYDLPDEQNVASLHAA